MISVSRAQWRWVQRSDEVMGAEAKAPSPSLLASVPVILIAQLPVDLPTTRSDR
jgi:hypothetical protein